MTSTLSKGVTGKLAAFSLASLLLMGANAQQANQGQNDWKDAGNPFMRGFLTGNDFRHYSQPEKLAYVTGIYDGYMFAPALGGKSANDQVLHDCLPNLASDQLLAIVEKYMKENPETWGGSMNFIVFTSLPKSCQTAIAENFHKQD